MTRRGARTALRGRGLLRRLVPRPGPLLIARGVAAVVALARLASVARTDPPIAPLPAMPTGTPVTLPTGTTADGTTVDVPADGITIVVPARDEAARIGPLLDAVVGAPGVSEVVVVDDGSTDTTAEVARRAGARVVTGAPLPDGWAGKAWALQQGVETARTEWVVTLDADTRPDPSLAVSAVTRAASEGTDLLTVAGSFECPTAPLRWLHPAMLTTLVYRFGPPGRRRVRPDRVMANGQCMVLPRDRFLATGGMAPVAGNPVEDVALARHLATTGHRVGFLDGSNLLRVRMYESFADAWRGWGRSLVLPGVEPRHRQVFDLGVVALAQTLPLLRLLTRRADALDLVLVLGRLGTLAGTAPSYDRRGIAYWASPLADGPATVALAGGILRRRQTWRGRVYPTPTR